MRMIKTLVLAAAIAAPLGFAVAGPMKGHPNLEAAQKALDTALDKITASQKANEWDEGGHAKKAKEAIDLAKAELVEAAKADNAKK
jgi:hypothetical protein